MTAGLLDLSRLAALLALLASFAILATRRAQPLAYSAQLALVGVAALVQLALQADWSLLIVALVLAAQGMLLWFNRPPVSGRTSFPVATVCGGLLLAVLATASTPSEGMGVPLAIVLLGLLGASSMPGPYGVLSLLNGVVLGMIVVPGLPLRAMLATVMAGLALVVVTDGRRVAWTRR